MNTVSLETPELAKQIRREIVQATHRAKASHSGGSLSIADILAVLYGRIMKHDPAKPDWEERDRFILSKGHCCSALYACLGVLGYFPREELLAYGEDGSRLMNHVSHHVPGVEFSTGSLGHGLPFAAGKALAAKRQSREWRVFCLVSDGELNEGSNWEAILFAGHHKLSRLCLIIDYNGIQSFGTVSEVLELDPLADKMRSFGWDTHEIDGHDHVAIEKVLQGIPADSGKPLCLVARTVKGKGVSYMENELLWHYRPPNDELLAQALREIDEQGGSK